MSKYTVKINDRTISIFKGETHIIDWDHYEWEDNPYVVPIIAKAIVLALAKPEELEGFLEDLDDEIPYDGIVMGEMPPDIQAHIKQTMIDYGIIDKDGNPIVHLPPEVIPEKKEEVRTNWFLGVATICGVLFLVLLTITFLFF